MTTKKQQNSHISVKINSCVKFLFSFLLLWLAYISFKYIFFEESDESILIFLWGLFFLLWGSSWFLQIFGLNNKIAVIKIANNAYIKKIIKILTWIIKILTWIVIIFLIIALLTGAFSIVAGLSATTIIIILLVLILLK